METLGTVLRTGEGLPEMAKLRNRAEKIRKDMVTSGCPHILRLICPQEQHVNHQFSKIRLLQESEHCFPQNGFP